MRVHLQIVFPDWTVHLQPLLLGAALPGYSYSASRAVHPRLLQSMLISMAHLTHRYLSPSPPMTSLVTDTVGADA